MQALVEWAGPSAALLLPRPIAGTEPPPSEAVELLGMALPGYCLHSELTSFQN